MLPFQNNQVQTFEKVGEREGEGEVAEDEDDPVILYKNKVILKRNNFQLLCCLENSQNAKNKKISLLPQFLCKIVETNFNSG